MWDWYRVIVLSAVATGCGMIGGFLWGFGSRAAYDLGLPGGQISVTSALLSGVLVAVIGAAAGICASGGATGAVALIGRRMRGAWLSRSGVAAIGAGVAAFGLLSLAYRDASYQAVSWGLAAVAALVAAATFVAVSIACAHGAPRDQPAPRAEI